MTWLRNLPGVVVATLAFILWSSAFAALYIAVSLGCAWGWDRPSLGGISLQHWVAAGVWALHLLVIGGLLAWGWTGGPLDNSEARFRPVLASGGAALALAATFWTGLPLLFSSACL